MVGDLHGQYYDLLTILDKAGDPETNSFLFMGDFVDRGAFGIGMFNIHRHIYIYIFKYNLKY